METLFFLGICALIVVLMVAGLWAQSQAKSLDPQVVAEREGLHRRVIAEVAVAHPEWSSKQVLAAAETLATEEC